MPKVSIIVCSHNRPAMLKQAIDSIFAQTLTDWELIIIDDFSTVSGVKQVIKDAMRDKRVRAVRTNYNINNLSLLWNIGLDMATGKYICTLDDDNKKETTYCQRMANFLDKNKDYDAVACFAHILQNDKVTGLFDMPAQMNNENIKRQNYVDSGCAMYRRTVINEIGWYDERLRSCDDWDYIKRIQLQTKGFGIIPEPLCYYRWHDENRTFTKVSLNDNANFDFIVNRKNYNKVWRTLLFHQNKNGITISQNNVLEGVRAALKSLPFIELTSCNVAQLKTRKPESLYDLVFIFAPFSINIKDIEEVNKYGKETLHFHIEDPQALGLNVERARFANYIFTNDIATKNFYGDKSSWGKVGFCPSISFDDINLKPQHRPRDLGVLFFGYGYESRKKLLAELLPKLESKGYPLLVVGNGYEKCEFDSTGELSQTSCLQLMEDTKIVILHSRDKTDLGGTADAIAPRSLARGYFEAGSGAMILLDKHRDHHSFGKDEVVFYESIDDLVAKVDYYMKNDKLRQKIGQAGKRRALRDFTYQMRIRQVINAFRSQRFGFEVR